MSAEPDALSPEDAAALEPSIEEGGADLGDAARSSGDLGFEVTSIDRK